MTSATAIPRADAATIRARLDEQLGHFEQAEGGRALLASDADGTLWDGDVGFDVFEALLASHGVREAAREALVAELTALGLPVEGDATALTAAFYEAYQTERAPHDRFFAMMAWVFAGWAGDEVDAFCARVLAETLVPARLRTELLDLFRWAEGRGVDVYVVSASPLPVIQAARPRLGVAADRVVAMTPAVGSDGVILPRLAGPIVYGEGKMAALESARPGARAALLGAFGDSAYDAAMLRAARVPVAVTPSPGLLAVASTIPGLVRLDR
jgi:phosphoserine phosphatase